MLLDLGTVRPGSTLRIPFSTFDKDDSSSITMTNFAAADILVYKDGSTTERASTAGYTATTDFDAKTGKHLAIIDLSDNTTAGFWAAGSEYHVAIDAVTVDGVTTGGWVARFRIGYPAAVLDTTIATLSTQTSFTLTDGPAEDDALNGMWAVIHDVASRVQWARVLILDYVGSTKTVTLVAGAAFTVATTDNISIIDMAPLQPATTGRTALVGTAGQVDANLTQAGGTNVTATGGRPEVNASHIAGSAISQSAGVANVNVTQLSGDSAAADNAEAFFDGTGYAGTNNVIPTVSTLTNAPGDSSGVTTLLSRLSAVRAGYLDNLSAGAVALASTFSGITSLAQWLGLLAGKQTGNATARTEIRATGAGSGTYDETTDSLEAVRDNTGANGAALSAVPWNAAWDAEVQSEVQDAIEVNHLDHLLAADYDPASKPGVATALLNELVESDAGVSRFTTNALEQAPSGGGGGATDWTADQRTALSSILGIPGSGTTPADPTVGILDTIRDLVTTVQTRVGTPSDLGSGATVAGNLVDIENQTDDIGAAGAGLTALATAAELAKVPKSDGTVSWNATAAAQLQTKATDALNAYDPPTRAEATTDANAIAALINALNNLSTAQVLTQVNAALDAAVADSVPADGSRPSVRQGVYMQTQFLLERTVAGTTVTVKKPDGVTALFTLTLDHATAPTAITRAT